MLISLKVKTLDAQTHELSVDNEITVRQFKDKVAEKTNISAEQQRIIYCGRVLADEKQLKEYDVNGKVVHVAERPPPSARGPSSGSSASGADNPPRRTARGMRSSPLFRALDGMVVGTMAIPMNPGMNNAQMQINPFTSSSSFCMNRITVARHMLECANNIAAFLEDPSRGLNNTSLDILAQGRWTMESTVVEVGITAGDIPQEQNIVDMLEGAVSAALRRNGNTNVTVVQLPTVFGPDENPDDPRVGNETTTVVVEEPMEDALDDSADSAALNTSTSTEDMETANEEDAVEHIDENFGARVPDSPAPPPPPSSTDAGAMPGTSSSTASVGSSTSVGSSGTTTSSTNSNTMESNSSNRRRTGTNVLADVIDQMRVVQTRLNPFVEQFYDMLRNEPTFEETDTTSRENAQRLYDRVSEAFHYMSHAQHAISDLLLDVSQPTPRYLACRPILVEQSGYVSSNNYLSAAAAAAAAGLGSLGGNARQQPQQQQQQQQQQQTNASQSPRAQASQSPAQTPSDVSAEAEGTPVSTTAVPNAPVEDPVDDPIVSPVVLNPVEIVGASPGVNGAVNEANGNNANNDPQMQVARLIQAVVNSAPIDAEFHVQINAPSIVSFGVPLNPPTNGIRTPQQQQQQQQENNAEATTGTPPGNNNANENNSPTETASGNSTDASAESPNQARATTATLPTTATQTRSTSRPHVQIGSLPPSGGWNGRVIPANMMSSFDRFLPCNSHHVRDSENANTTNNANTGGTTGSAPSGQITPNSARVNQRTLRTITDLFRHGPTIVAAPPLLGVRAAAGVRPAAAGSSSSAARTSDQQPSGASTGASPANETMRRVRVRVQLLNFINEHMFNGTPISEDSMTLAVNKAIRWLYDVLIFLPQYDLPQYDSRDSIENLLRHSLPLIINLVNGSVINENPRLFEQRLKDLCAEFIKRLFSILVVCAGRVNAEIYWCELMRTLMTSLRSNFREEAEALQFLQIYVNTTVPTATDTNDAQQFLVLRNVENETSETDSDVEMAEVPSTSQNSRHSPEVDDSETMQLDSVAIGREDWHSNFPAEWVPIISHDMQRQREMQTPQPPFSDAYISSMSVKRRKMIQNSKPTSDIKSLVSDSVKEAIRAVGVGSSTASNQSLSADEITAAIAADANVQASYSEALRTSFRDRLKTDADYKAERFPQTSKFFNK